MKKIHILISLLTFSLLSANIFAGSAGGKVAHLMVHAGDVAMFTIKGGHHSKPACAKYGWALSLKTEKGRAMYALLLSAAGQGKTVGIQGYGSCGIWGDREQPAYAWINY